MSDVIVRAENLGKRYPLGGRRECYHTFRDTFVRNLSARWHGLWKNGARHGLRPPAGPTSIWALKDVSFDVKRGEVVGLIGRNGAGKSTLLKVLSRITEPTEGNAQIYGRVGSLLEVGTGFHPELTGRENTFLNGAILGMRRAEISRKFDEIVAFAEIENFVDTPVKHYSTGMYLRLAFAVAANLQTEILLVDEVLAVGDASFQKKCLGKMGEVAHQGRTVFFVSHNMGAISALCPNTFLLSNGQLASQGPSTQVVSEYLGAGAVASFTEVPAANHIRGDQAVRVERLLLTTLEGLPQSEFQIWEPMQIHIGFSDAGQRRSVFFWLAITAADGQTVVSSFQSDTPSLVTLPAKSNALRVTIPSLLLTPGQYLLSVGIASQYRQEHDVAEHALAFRVLPQFFESGAFDGRAGRTTERWDWEMSEFPDLSR